MGKRDKKIKIIKAEPVSNWEAKCALGLKIMSENQDTTLPVATHHVFSSLPYIQDAVRRREMSQMAADILGTTPEAVLARAKTYSAFGNR